MDEQHPHAADIQQILTSWEAAKTTIQANPAILEQTLPGISLEQFDEVIRTICSWAGRIRAPHGFRPVFPFTKIQFASHLKNLAAHAANMAGNPSAYFAGFATQLTACIAPIAGATLFSEKGDRLRASIEVHGELEQHLALMHTAQTELSQKSSVLNAAQSVADEIGKSAERVSSFEATISTAHQSVGGILTSAAERLAEIDESKEAAEELEAACKNLLSQNEILKGDLQKQKTNFDEFVVKSKEMVDKINAECSKQSELINSLLSGATSSALATAFGRGKRRYLVSQWIWGVGFVLSIGALFGFGLADREVLKAAQGSGDIWIYLAHRLPFAAPMVWLGWFCSMQYGNVIRLMEDYAFKEATSIAFAGYRDHMEHLANVNDEEANNALERLALVTISVLGNEPLRLLQKQHQDASPMERLIGLFADRKARASKLDGDS